MAEKLHPHPGLILKCRLRDRHISALDFGTIIKYCDSTIIEVIEMKRAIPFDLCERLAWYFKDDASFWLKLQINYDLSIVAFETSYPSRHKTDLMTPPLPDRFG